MGLLGFISRLGSQVYIEEQIQETIDDLLMNLKSIPNWEKSVAQVASNKTGVKVAKVVDELKMLVWRIKKNRRNTSLVILREYANLLEQVLRIAQSTTKKQQIAGLINAAMPRNLGNWVSRVR